MGPYISVFTFYSKRINGYVMDLFATFLALFALDGWRSVASQMHYSLYKTIHSTSPYVVGLASLTVFIGVVVHVITNENVGFG